MRKFLIAAAVLAVAACGEKAKTNPDSTGGAMMSPDTGMMATPPDTGMKPTTMPDSTTMKPDSTMKHDSI